MAICGAREESENAFRREGEGVDGRHMARGTRLISRKKYASKARPKMLRRNESLPRSDRLSNEN